MNRRSFLSAAVAAPVAVAIPAVAARSPEIASKLPRSVMLIGNTEFIERKADEYAAALADFPKAAREVHDAMFEGESLRSEFVTITAEDCLYEPRFRVVNIRFSERFHELVTAAIARERGGLAVG